MFVVFEGPDISNRNVLFEKARLNLGTYYDTVFTEEPGGTACGKKIKDILDNASVNKVNNTTIALLEAADRAQHCERIQNLLDRGFDVFSNGFKESSLVYSGYMKDSSALIYNLNHVATRGLKQDLTVFVFKNPEDISIEFKEEYNKAYKGYMDLYTESKDSGEECILLNTSGLSEEELYNKFYELFKPYMINLNNKKNDNRNFNEF